MLILPKANDLTEDLEFQHISFWIQIIKLLVNCMFRALARKLEGMIREVEEIDGDDQSG